MIEKDSRAIQVPDPDKDLLARLVSKTASKISTDFAHTVFVECVGGQRVIKIHW